MKTLCLIESNKSVFIFNDNEVIEINDVNIIVGIPIKFIINELNSNNSKLWEKIQAPDDWIGVKYLFDGTTWTKNPDYIEPPVASQAE